jgi:hypothetical protein
MFIKTYLLVILCLSVAVVKAQVSTGSIPLAP